MHAGSIETTRLVLAPWSEDDRGPFAELARDPRVMRYIGGGSTWDWDRIEEVFERQRQHWGDHGFGWRAAVDKSSGERLGFVGLNHVGPEATEITEDEVEIGWWLHPDRWGRGLATEGALVLRDEAFGRVGLDRIIGRHKPPNVASGRIMQRIGMSLERDAVGRHGDTVRVYAMSRDEWLRLRGRTSRREP